MSAYNIIEESVHPLQPAVTLRRAPSEPLLTQAHPRLFSRSGLKSHFQHVFCRSKAAHIILLWNVVVGISFGAVNLGSFALGFAFLNKNGSQGFHIPLAIILGALAFIALIQFLFYPLGGLIADLKCGRYKVVSCSTTILLCGYTFLVIFGALMASSKNKFEITPKNGYRTHISEIALLAAAVILLIVGFTGFQANSVQFGLDQLQDAPSKELSAFLHWFVWTDNVGHLVMCFLVSLMPCSDYGVKGIMYTPIPVVLILTLSLLLSCYRRRWFHSEPTTHNPYGTIYKVLKYVAQHSSPERPKAETYCDNERPGRIEYAKDRFGGPFTAATVEDVKTFLRVVVMLFAVGPIHTFAVGFNTIFPLYALHLSSNKSTFPTKKNSCTIQWVFFETGNLAFLVTAIGLPLYIVFVLPCKRCYLKTMLSRLTFGMFLMLLASLAMFITHTIGNHQFHKSHENGSTISCLFNSSYSETGKTTLSPTLQLPFWVHVFPNVLKGVANPLVSITILEFISAQSPHTMKGLFLGTYYAVRGLFTIIGYFFVAPFAFPKAWRQYDQSLFDCGVSYNLFNTLFGAFGLILLLAASRYYQYRRRGERPYEPWDVEEIYHAFMNRQRPNVRQINSPSGKLHSLDSNAQVLENCNYGAT